MSEKYTQDKVKNLIGLNWGEVDCLSLSLCASEVINGYRPQIDESVEWTEENIEVRSQQMLNYVTKYTDAVTAPVAGDIGIMRICGCIHIYTVISDDLILHARRNRKSCLEQFSSAIRRRTIGFYRWKR